jgi:hypothetical protein
MPNPLVQFYRREAPDDRGRMLDQILAQDDDWLESTHDFIQWVFPLKERSRFNATAPLLDAELMSAFREDQGLQDRAEAVFERMLDFYGLRLTQTEIGEPAVERAHNYENRRANWLRPSNHNFLRITRILKSLSLMGLDPLAAAFFIQLRKVYVEESEIIGPRTLKMWKCAADGV